MRTNKSLRLAPGHAPLAEGVSCLWRRLEAVGHDACRYGADELGWLVEGCAVFTEGGQVATLSYRLRCDEAWRSRSASIHGWVGAETLAIEIVHTPEGGWRVDGQERPELAGLVDIDLGFTPATNTNAIRRMDLSVGEQGETTAVWLDTEDWQVKPLRQIYRRVEPQAYDYESPTHDFRAQLTIDEAGVIADYPGLWRRE